MMKKTVIPILLCAGLLTLFFALKTRTVKAAETAEQANISSPIGTNLHLLADWSTEYVFVDAFKASRPWLTQSSTMWDTAESHLLQLDANGWVMRLPQESEAPLYDRVGTVMFNGVKGHYPAGRYTVIYEGEGTLQYGLDAVKNIALSVPNREIIDVTPTNSGILLRIMATNPNNYIRNIRVLLPNFDETMADTEMWHPNFLQSISSYRVIRFMDWMRTNWDANGPMRAPQQPQEEMVMPLEQNEVDPFVRSADFNTPVLWANRPQPSNARYSTEAGVPAETMIDLVNRIKADPWFNMPHQADDDYIRNFARTVRDRLNTRQYVYVEYSNEVWNSTYGQSAWVQQQANALWPTTTTPAFTKLLNWYGKRSAEMCDIWQQEWGAQADRVICVIATQSTNSWVGQQMLDCPLWEHAPCHEHNVDSVAIAPYFGQHIGNPTYQTTVNQWATASNGLDTLFAELSNGSILPNTMSKTSLSNALTNMSNYATLAQQRGLSLVAYEGGQHLAAVGAVQNNTNITAMFSAANRDPRMIPLYEQYLAHWHAIGGQMFVHFNSTGLYSQHGNWGAREFYDAPSAPKNGAIEQYAQKTPCSWAFCFPKQPLSPAVISLPSADVTPTGERILPVTLTTNGHALTVLRFTIEYSRSQISFSPLDLNGDIVPDDIELHLPAGFTGKVITGTEGDNATLLVDIVRTSGNATLPDGVLLEMSLFVLGGGPGLRFTRIDRNDPLLPSVVCESAVGSAECIAEGAAFANVPTAVALQDTSADAFSIFSSTLVGVLFTLLLLVTLKAKGKVPVYP